MVRVAINGFGRIGRQVLQAGYKEKGIEWVAVNDLTDTRTLAHLLKYDSVYGVFEAKVDYTENELIVNNKRIKVFSEKEPEKLPWKKLKADVVVESTGIFTDREGAMRHIKAGAKKVLISAPAKDPDFFILRGVNDKQYDKKKHHIVSNSSCTTNCLAPMVKVLQDAYGIKKGFMITVHAYTADQRLVDAPHRDLRRARAAGVSIVPTTTGAAKTIGEIIPELRGKLDGFALRVPVICGSHLTLTAQLNKNATVEQINAVFANASKNRLKGILQHTEEPIVSRDILRNPNSCIFDALSTHVTDGNLATVCGWYDNEWGFSCRMVEVIKMMM